MDQAHPADDYFPWLLHWLADRICRETGEKVGPMANRIGVNDRPLYNASADHRSRVRKKSAGAFSAEKLAAICAEGLRTGAISKEDRDRIWYAWLRHRIVVAGEHAARLVREKEDALGAPSSKAWIRERRGVVERNMRENGVTDS